MKNLWVFLSLAAILFGIVEILIYLRFGPFYHFADFIFGVIAVAAGLTYLLRLSGFGGLNTK